MAATSNIRVYVQWAERTIFAGEDIECQITFKNIAPSPNSQRSSLQAPSANGVGERQKRATSPLAPSATFKTNAQIPRGPPLSAQAHRSTASVNLPSLPGRSQYGGAGSEKAGHSKANAGGPQHKRSLSIISMGASEDTTDGTMSEARDLPRRPGRGHGRAASLQILPGRSGSTDRGPGTAPLYQRPLINPTSMSQTTSPLTPSRFPDSFPPRRSHGILSAPNTPGKRRSGSRSAPFSPMTPQLFKFPASPRDARPGGNGNGAVRVPNSQEPADLVCPRAKDDIPVIIEQSAPTARILSPSSHAGTPRSSGEFYTQSNNSTETLASEYLPQQAGRTFSRLSHLRKPSNLGPNNQRLPENLMMGYAQINGTLTLDASLIKQAPFEEVKRKGIVGGQGGGVVGLENGKNDGGILGAFGWGSFSRSLGGFLGGSELSSIKGMRGPASSKTIPLLSTPQSILFVDLRLGPGDSKTYKYSFQLPKGLPPSHKGKAIKVSYQLTIGTQRPGGAKEQQVKSVELPFRLLGSVNDHGELLGHDLMSPYIILRDQARVQSLEHVHSSLKSMPKLMNKSKLPEESSLADFLSYADELLQRPRINSSMGLVSPTAVLTSRQPSSFSEPTTAKEAIDLAILRSNITARNQQSANRFEIARNGRRVAVIMLARPAWRLGETITAAIDFTDADIPCYALHASLESSEKVDPAIALRSSASIHRVTRKIHASQSESTLYARRIVFSPAIPITATPAFITSGIGLEWKIRIEFVTPEVQAPGSEPNSDDEVLSRSSSHGSTAGNKVLGSELLEEVSRDERNVILVAAEQLRCESFEIAVPIMVYGAVVGGAVERSDGEVEGLVV